MKGPMDINKEDVKELQEKLHSIDIRLSNLEGRFEESRRATIEMIRLMEVKK
jgi:hypothetical protein